MQKVNYTVTDGVAIIELNDPPANTYSYEMMLEIDGAVLAARMDPAVHVMVLRGAWESKGRDRREPREAQAGIQGAVIAI